MKSARRISKKQLGILVLVALFTVFVLFLSLRGIALRKATDAVSGRLREHHYTAHWDGSEFRWLRVIFFRGIYIQDEKSENEIYIDSLSVKIRLLPLVTRNLRIRNLRCKNISVRFNADSPVDSAKIQQPEDTSGLVDRFREKDFAAVSYHLIRRFFRYVPARVAIDKMEVRVVFDKETTLIGLEKLQIVRGEMNAGLFMSGSGRKIVLPLAGHFNKSSSEVKIIMTNPEGELFPLPLFRDRFGIEAGFDSLGFTLNLDDRHRNLVNIGGDFSYSGFGLRSERLSSSDIRVDHFRSSFLVHIGQDYVEFDSVTRVELNRIPMQTYLRFSLEDDPVLSFRILPARWDAGDFFSSLPEGMFTSLKGFNASGGLTYYLTFSVNLSKPDSLIFDTRLTSSDFKILQYGTDDYRMINGSFYHQVYERGILKATFLVGPGNPDFVPFDQISPMLRAAVMTSEDGSFFHHNGFNPGAFRESMVTNIKENRFARGGSTISMQLVKNIFLTRNKNIARKIEEALIVWLIENENLVAKQRMYEVYLNIIEWGPGIYGINQASRFYFDKAPLELNLQESIYLASIVPHPKWYRYSFESNGVLRPFFGNYLSRMEEIMLRRNLMEPGDTAGVLPVVFLTGPAANIFSSPDTVPADTLALKELEILPAVVE